MIMKIERAIIMPIIGRLAGRRPTINNKTTAAGYVIAIQRGDHFAPCELLPVREKRLQIAFSRSQPTHTHLILILILILVLVLR